MTCLKLFSCASKGSTRQDIFYIPSPSESATSRAIGYIAGGSTPRSRLRPRGKRTMQSSVNNIDDVHGGCTDDASGEGLNKGVACSCASISPKSQPSLYAEDNDDACGICFCDIVERGKLDCCDHRFCMDCILRWSEVSLPEESRACSKRMECRSGTEVQHDPLSQPWTTCNSWNISLEMSRMITLDATLNGSSGLTGRIKLSVVQALVLGDLL
eukprot:2106100-Pyramimonas_sp.AAC.1